MKSVEDLRTGAKHVPSLNHLLPSSLQASDCSARCVLALVTGVLIAEVTS